MKTVKTLEEHRDYVEGFARISFYFARKHLTLRLPEKKMSQLLKDHTPLLYHGLNYAPAVWESDDTCLKILAWSDQYASLEPEAFEEAMTEKIAPFIRERAELNYPAAVGVKAPASWNCGSLKYDEPDENSDEIVFHIANAVGPRSIFDDPDYLVQCFRLLLKETQIRFDPRYLTTSTWLNGREEFLRCFPREWRDNLQLPAEENPIPAWHFGWWGQLVTGRGTINPKTADFVRRKGFLKYPCVGSRCSYKNMIEHLAHC